MSKTFTHVYLGRDWFRSTGTSYRGEVRDRKVVTFQSMFEADGQETDWQPLDPTDVPSDVRRAIESEARTGVAPAVWLDAD